MLAFNFWLKKLAKTRQKLLVIGGTVLALNACGPGLDSLGPFSIGGTVSGLGANQSLTLQKNGADNKPLTTSGNFTFDTKLPGDADYVVTVSTQPAGQFCTVTGGAGKATANVTGVSVQCVDLLSIGGSVNGLAANQSVTLQNNGADNKPLNTNGNFVFDTRLPGDADYVVTVLIQPVGQFCSVSGGAGKATANVTGVSVQCVDLPTPADPWTGTKQFGVASAITYGSAVATDAAGNVFVAGTTNGVLDGFVRYGNNDFFVSKYNSSGVKQYSRQLGAAGPTVDTFGNSVATDADGNVYVVGYTTGNIGNNALTGVKDAFVTKLDNNLQNPVTRQLGVAGAETVGNSVSIDVFGNVYVVGYTTGKLVGTTRSITKDFFIAKYNRNLSTAITVQSGVTGAETLGNGIALDYNGNVYVAGSTTGVFATNLPLDVGTQHFFITKFSSNLVTQQTRQLGGLPGTSTTGTSVATDASGSVYVAGHTTGVLDGIQLTGTMDLFVTKFNNTLGVLFNVQLGVTGANTLGNGIAIDSNGNVYVAGSTTGVFATDAVLDGGTQDFFITKYSSSLVPQYTRQLGGATGTFTEGSSVKTDIGGNVFVAGFTLGNLDGNTRIGQLDAFVSKFNSSLVKQ